MENILHRQVIAFRRVILVVETLPIVDVNDVNKNMLLFTRIQGDRFLDHALNPTSI